VDEETAGRHFLPPSPPSLPPSLPPYLRVCTKEPRKASSCSFRSQLPHPSLPPSLPPYLPEGVHFLPSLLLSLHPSLPPSLPPT